MTLVEVVILVGAQCVSPLETGPGVTEASKVSCAVLIRQDKQTSEIEILPRAAATDPDVIAMLVKPRPERLAGRPGRLPIAATADVTGSITPAPLTHIEPASAAVEPDTISPPEPAVAKPVVKAKRAAASTTGRRAVASRRSDACGSYKAVWYTNKEGRRRYRCVRAG